LSRLVDGVLLVVRENVTPMEAAEKSLAALDQAFVVGVVFNGSTGSLYSHYDLSEPLQSVNEKDASVRAKPSKEGSMGISSLVPLERPDPGGPRL
jgi:Mrp family chromosome partitioning ATPase